MSFRSVILKIFLGDSRITTLYFKWKSATKKTTWWLLRKVIQFERPSSQYDNTLKWLIDIQKCKTKDIFRWLSVSLGNIAADPLAIRGYFSDELTDHLVDALHISDIANFDQYDKTGIFRLKKALGPIRPNTNIVYWTEGYTLVNWDCFVMNFKGVAVMNY